MSGRTFSRYTTADVAKGRFYQRPKVLFGGELKQGLSNDAKVLYSLLKDRHELCLQNNWVNADKEFYLVYTREDMADMLGCSQPTLRKSKGNSERIEMVMCALYLFKKLVSSNVDLIFKGGTSLILLWDKFIGFPLILMLFSRTMKDWIHCLMV